MSRQLRSTRRTQPLEPTQQNLTSSCGATSSLPSELHALILHYVANPSSPTPLRQITRDLLSCALTSRALLGYSLKHLYRTVLLDSPDRLNRFSRCETRRGYETVRVVLKNLVSCEEEVGELLNSLEDLGELKVVRSEWPRGIVLNQLEILTFSECIDSDIEVNPTFSFPLLNRLSISGSSLRSFPTRFWISFYSRAPNLSHIELQDIDDRYTPIRLVMALDATSILLPTLTTLTLHHTPDRGAEEPLRKLIPSSILVPLCTSLERLVLIYSPAFKCDTVVTFVLGTMGCLIKLENLTSLSIVTGRIHPCTLLLSGLSGVMTRVIRPKAVEALKELELEHDEDELSTTIHGEKLLESMKDRCVSLRMAEQVGADGGRRDCVCASELRV